MANTSAHEHFLEEALVYVYIGQYVRDDGPSRAGVLAQDAETYFSQIQQLRAENKVTGASWVHLEGFVTTPTGAESARRILKSKLDVRTGELHAALGRLPPRALHYVIREIIAKQAFSPMEVELLRHFDAGDGRDVYLCLLNSPELLGLRNQLLYALEKLGVLVRAHSYVSTKGGRIDDERFVAAPELVDVLKRFVSDAGWFRLWPQDLVDKHVAYHLLVHSYTPGYPISCTSKSWRIAYPLS